MFQQFSDISSLETGRKNLPLLLQYLDEHNLDGFVMSRADEFGGENIAPYAERLAWLTGFTGSAGSAVILKTKAAIFVDGRYTLQVREQVDGKLLEPVSIIETSVAEWLEAHLQGGETIGFDPWLYTSDAVTRLEKACAQRHATLKPLTVNPIDTIWSDHPEHPKNPIVPHPLELAGQPSEQKLAAIANMLAGKADATFITQGDSIAWLFNIRGSDVACAPLPPCLCNCQQRRRRLAVHRSGEAV
nr:aminopeptidase P family N-terminal domain-containing protein [uncultured Cohaesibacter sp.]